MLCEITIENVAVIEKATACFGQGFTVLTGETGAGKSILIDSINVILGNRTNRDIVRSGAQKACIWAKFKNIPNFVVNKLQTSGYEYDDELLLYREVLADGKSNCRINGSPATAAMLRDICGGLINIHGQHDSQNLLNPVKHVDILDSFARNEELCEEYKDEYKRLIAVRSEIVLLSRDEEEKKRSAELLSFEAEEIESAQLEESEEDELVKQRTIAQNSQNICEALRSVYTALNGEDEVQGATALLADAMRQMANISSLDKELELYNDTFSETYYTLCEVASDIQNYLSKFEYNSIPLNEIEQRLDLIYRLKQKYGSTVGDIIEYGEKARQTLKVLEGSEIRLDELFKQQNMLEEHMAELADKLTASRKNAFDRLNSEIADALYFLNMPGIVFNLRTKLVSFGENGQDEMEFYISTNPGEVPKPLAKVASGGELARIMLAIKSALAGRDNVPTVIYDEIDTGVSGMAAARIGQLLRKTADGRQVICVTHTAQVAANASGHLLIKKEVLAGRTYTAIDELTREERVNELARIISADKITELALASAEEMLELAGN